MSKDIDWVDERAAFEAAIEASGGMRPGNYSSDYDRYVSERLQGQYEGWKLACAALTASAPSHGEQVREVVPEGYALVPERMHLSREAIESITAHCGDGQEDAGYGPYSDGVLWVGQIEEEDGSKTYGLHIATADYPEQGSTTLVEFSAAPSAGSQEQGE